MLTDYPVRCPHEGCGWRGCLFPLVNQDASRPAQLAQRVVSFQCPRCARTWQARIVSDDAVNLPLEEPVGQA